MASEKQVVMDNRISGYNGSMSRFNFRNQAPPICSNPNASRTIPEYELVSGKLTSDTEGQLLEVDSPEDCDFSDAVLKYINHILMEEDVEDKTCMFQESAALQAAEKSLYEIIGQQYPASGIHQEEVPRVDPSIESSCDRSFGESRSSWHPYDSESSCQELYTDPNLCGYDELPVSRNLVLQSSNCQVIDITDPRWNSYDGHQFSSNIVSQSTSYSCSSSSNGRVIDLTQDSPMSTPRNIDIFGDNGSDVQVKLGGILDQKKCLPMNDNLIAGRVHDESVKKSSAKLVAKLEKEFDKKGCLDLSRGKKNPYHDSLGLEDERTRKQSAIYYESSISSDMFDKVLLCSAGKNESAIRRELNSVTKTAPQNEHLKGSDGVKAHGKRKNVVDLNTLLTLCAQAVAADDQKAANKFLKQIRQHATPTGDGMQRLAYYFSNGLEARMAGSGTQIYKSLLNMPTSASDVLKAYHIYLATCPFRKLSNFFSNKTFMNQSQKVNRLHIVDFGILYGFQWPSFLQRLSSRIGGPPKLRITGIDLPCPGFRPAERVEETGRRLASYAETFKVPFEFNAIAQKWETIRVEDIKIEEDELLVVNCVYRFRNLLDESVMVNCPRNQVLKLIKMMNPSVFVMGILNGAYNAPFFISRFREALFHYSSIFDMLEANIPREVHERMLLEKTIFGQEAMNVIACEDAERIERPETYKQWQVRTMRAGFEMLPLDKDMIQMAKTRVKLSYNKDFVVDEDGKWMLQGWKGRTVYALSSWRPLS